MKLLHIFFVFILLLFIVVFVFVLVAVGDFGLIWEISFSLLSWADVRSWSLAMMIICWALLNGLFRVHEGTLYLIACVSVRVCNVVSLLLGGTSVCVSDRRNLFLQDLRGFFSLSSTESIQSSLQTKTLVLDQEEDTFGINSANRMEERERRRKKEKWRELARWRSSTFQREGVCASDKKSSTSPRDHFHRRHLDDPTSRAFGTALRTNPWHYT